MSCDDVVLRYPVPGGDPVEALRGVHVEAPAGAVTAIAGPSGSGKSSLLRLMAALDRPTAGRVLLEGEDIARMSTRRRRALRRARLGFVPSHASAALARGITVGQEIALAALLRGIDSGWRDDADRQLATMGLDGRWAARTEHLSAGEQQRVALVAALVGRPLVLLADEPTAALDAASGERVLAELRGAAAAGTAVVIATHDPAVVAAADVLVRLRSGQVAP